jgi:hypothetical protein
LGAANQIGVPLAANGLQALTPATGRCSQTNEIVFWISSASDQTCWCDWIRKYGRIDNGPHYVRETTFAEVVSRIRKNPDIVAPL